MVVAMAGPDLDEVAADGGDSDDNALCATPELQGDDEELAEALACLRLQLDEAARLSATGGVREAARLYDAVFGKVLVLSKVDRVAEVRSVDLRLLLLRASLGAARAFSLLGDWQMAVKKASEATEAAMMPNSRAACEFACATALLDKKQHEEAAGKLDQGWIAHRDAPAAFLLRARARLRLNDGYGAVDDAATARNMAIKLCDESGADAAEGIRMQAQIHCAHGDKSNVLPNLPDPNDLSDIDDFSDPD